jgi:hypothetical protein
MKTMMTKESRSKLARGLVALTLGAGIVLESGCAAVLVGGGAAAGAGGYAYMSGQLKSTEGASMDRVWEASQKAMKELGYVPATQRRDGFKAQLVARTVDDKKINLYLKRLSDNSTEIRIRVGVFGSESLSRLILEKTEKELS